MRKVCKSQARDFLGREGGAANVDWVVLSALVVGLATAWVLYLQTQSVEGLTAVLERAQIRFD